MSTKQLEHHEMKRASKKFPISVLSDGLRLAKNVGAIFRISEAFGVNKLFIYGLDEKLPNKKFTRVARSTEQVLDYEEVKNVSETILELKKDHQVIAIEITNDSFPIQEFVFHPDEKYLFVIGAESKGISQEVLDLCDVKLHINMFGLNSSMNVTHALSVALYEYTRTR